MKRFLSGLLCLTVTAAGLGCGAPSVEEGAGAKDEGEVISSQRAAITAPANMGRYCSVKWASGGWAFAWYSNLTQDPCNYILANSGPGGTIQRAGLYSTTGVNNVVVRCDPSAGWVMLGTGTGGNPLSWAYNQASGRTGCVFTVAPREMPIFDLPYAAGTSVSPVTGIDFARGPYNTLDLRNEFGQPTASTSATKVDWKARDKSSTGYINDHDGWDLGMPSFTPLRAPADGVVLAARFRDVTRACPGGYASPTQGEVFIKHTVSGGSGTNLYDEYFVTFFAHLSTIIVNPGTPVKQGQIIGYSGNTGCSSGPHLHLGTFRTTNTASAFVHDFVINSDFSEGKNQNSANGYEVMIDPHGFYPPAGFDPWAWRGYPYGALSINLWKPLQAPPTGNW